MLLGTLGAGFLGNILARKEIVRAGPGNKKGKGILKAGYGNKWVFLMLPYPLTNFEIQMHYENEPRFDGVYSKHILPKKIKDGTYVINLGEYADVGTHSIALFCNRNEIVYFNSFDVEHVPEEIKDFVGNKNVVPNIFRVQANNSIMRGYFYIGCIDFMLAVKKLTDFTSFFFSYEFKKMTI